MIDLKTWLLDEVGMNEVHCTSICTFLSVARVALGLPTDQLFISDLLEARDTVNMVLESVNLEEHEILSLFAAIDKWRSFFETTFFCSNEATKVRVELDLRAVPNDDLIEKLCAEFSRNPKQIFEYFDTLLTENSNRTTFTFESNFAKMLLQTLVEVANSSPAYQTLFLQSPSHSIISNLIRVCISSQHVELAVIALESVIALVHRHTENQVYFGGDGFCGLLLYLLERLDGENIKQMERCLSLIEQLSCSEIAVGYFLCRRCPALLTVILTRLGQQYASITLHIVAIVTNQLDHSSTSSLSLLSLLSPYLTEDFLSLALTTCEHYTHDDLLIVEHTLQLIRALGQHSSKQRQSLLQGEQGVRVSHYIRTMHEQHADQSAAVAEACLHAVSVLSIENNLFYKQNEITGEQGVQMVLAWLQRRQVVDLHVAEHYINYIHHLLLCCFIEQEEKQDGKNHISSGSSVSSSVTTKKKRMTPASLLNTLNCGKDILEWVIAIAKSYHAHSSVLSEQTFGIFLSLAEKSSRSWLQIAHAEGLELSCQILRYHACRSHNNGDSIKMSSTRGQSIAEVGLDVMQFFLAQETLLQTIINDLNAMHILVQLVQQHGIDSYAKVLPVVVDQWICLSGYRVAAAVLDSANQQSDGLACQVSVRCLLHFYQDSKLEKEGRVSAMIASLKWIKALADLSHVHLALIQIPEFCPLLIDMMHDVAINVRDIAVLLMDITAALCTAKNNITATLGKLGVCRAVLVMIAEHAGMDLDTAEHSLHLLAVLAKWNKASLGELGACEAIAQLLLYYVPMFDVPPDCSSDLVLQACTAIYNMSNGDCANQVRFNDCEMVPYLQFIIRSPYILAITKQEIKDAINILRYGRP